MITALSRGMIKFQYRSSKYSCYGELLFPESVIEFVLYADSMRKDGEEPKLSDFEKDSAIEMLKREFQLKGRILTVEK